MKRQVKVLETGISPSVAPLVGAVIDDIPEVIFVTDTSGKLGFEYTESIKRKDRNAKTRVFNVGKNEELDSWFGCSLSTAMMMINNYNDYRAPKLSRIPNFNENFHGNISDFKAMM